MLSSVKIAPSMGPRSVTGAEKASSMTMKKDSASILFANLTNVMIVANREFMLAICVQKIITLTRSNKSALT